MLLINLSCSVWNAIMQFWYSLHEAGGIDENISAFLLFVSTNISQHWEAVR